MHISRKQPLPDREAQLEMAPRNRAFDAPLDARDAAVLALLTPTGDGCAREDVMDWRVLLIRRNCYPGAHSGQIALPGGKWEEDDATYWDTACREAFEEVGVEKNGFRKIGALSALYVAHSNFLIHPFAAIATAAQNIATDEREVADYKNIPIKIFNPANAVSMRFSDRDGALRTAPAWRYEEYVIWGATAMILAELYRLADSDAFFCL